MGDDYDDDDDHDDDYATKAHILWDDGLRVCYVR